MAKWCLTFLNYWRNGILQKTITFLHQKFLPVSMYGDKHPKQTFELIQKRDAIKKQWCKNNHIPLLEIPYWDIDNVKEIISQFFKDFSYEYE